MDTQTDAALRREIEARQRAEEELRGVVAHARCILWHADIIGEPGWENFTIDSPPAFKWDMRVQNEAAAQQVLPLEVPPGWSYKRAWVASRHADDYKPMWQRSSLAMVKGERSYQQEFRCTDRFGKVHWLSEDAQLEPTGPGQWRAFGVVIDITESKRAQEDARFQADILVQINDGVVATGANGAIIYWNKGAEQIYGIAAADAVGNTWDQIVDYRLQGDITTAEIIQWISAGQAWRGESVHHREGQEVHVEISLSCLRDENSQVCGTLAIIRDVTAQKVAQAALRDSQERFESFMRYNPAIAFIKDEEGRYVFMSEGAEHQTGRPAAAWIGKTDLELWPAHEGAMLRQDDLAVLKSGMPDKRQRALTDASGSVRHWVAFKFTIESTSGRRFLAGISLDVTDRERAETALRQSEREHREAAESNRLLLQELDHRVRNNLAGLLGLIDVMRQKTDDVQIFADALEARLHAMAHVHQLLARTGYRAVELRTLVGSLLDAMSRMAVHSTRLAIEGPVVRIAPRQSLPLTMILTEWFTNSCKYGAHSVPGGQLRVCWEAGDDGIRLTWEETGGPSTAEPEHTSLGTELIKGFATADLHGRCSLNYTPAGARHVLEFAPE